MELDKQAFSRGKEWSTRVPPAAAPWFRRVVVDFDKSSQTRRILGVCALLGATEYADITPAMLDRLFEDASTADRYRIAEGLRPFLQSDFAPEDTRMVAREKYKIRYDGPRRCSWDDVVCAVPYEQRPLALRLCDAWRRQEKSPSSARRAACRRGIIHALRATGATTVVALRGLRCQGKINQDLQEAPELTPEERKAAREEVQVAIELVRHLAPGHLPEPDPEIDPLYCEWVEEAVKSAQFRNLTAGQQSSTLLWARRVIPPRARDWGEITAGRVTELVRQARGAGQNGKTRYSDAPLRYALQLMPVRVDLTRYWEPVSPLRSNGSRQEVQTVPNEAILPSGEIDPRYVKEEPGLDALQELCPDWRTTDGLAGVDYASQRALIREQAAWAAQFPGLFKARGGECYTREELHLVRQAQDGAPVATDYARDVVRCALSRVLLALDAADHEADEDRPALVARLGAIIGDAVRDAARQLHARPRRRELTEEDDE